jgi:RNA polymerase sigma-70 factor (ECF subfamily)
VSPEPSPFDELLRIEGGRVLATLIRLCGDVDLAEDGLQDAIEEALRRWPVTGLPRNPAAWLTTTGRNKLLDRLRRESQRADRERAATHLLTEWPDGGGERSPVADDQLRLLFTCCHPALAPEHRVALTLRTVARLTTAEIAAAFLVPEATMAQRLSRAKRKIAVARIPYRVPEAHELPDRLPAVLAVVYVVFTTGHHAPAGELGDRVDLATDAVRLARLLVDLMPDEPECAGLLALLLATHARWPARLDAAGDAVLLADQDRSRWDHAAIAEAGALVDAALRRGRPGPYQLQAAIACVHGEAPSFAATDWSQIAALYAALERLVPTAVVRVNRAVAVAHAEGAEAGLALLDGLDGVERWHLAWSARAELLARAGRTAEAIEAFQRALGCECNETDRRHLERRVAAVRRGCPQGSPETTSTCPVTHDDAGDAR